MIGPGAQGCRVIMVVVVVVVWKFSNHVYVRKNVKSFSVFSTSFFSFFSYSFLHFLACFPSFFFLSSLFTLGFFHLLLLFSNCWASHGWVFSLLPVSWQELWHWPPPTCRSWLSQWGRYGIWSIPHVVKESHAIGVCCERFGCCLLTLRGVELLHWAATLNCPWTRGGLHQVGQQDWLTQIFTHLHFLLSKKKRVTQGFPIELESSCQQQQPPPKVCWRRVSSLYPKSDTPPIEDQKSGNRSRSLMGVLPLEIIADLHRHCQDMVLVVALRQESPHGRN